MTSIVQFILAADRGNRGVAHCYETRHPAVMIALEAVVDTCEARGVPGFVFALASDLVHYDHPLPSAAS